jgi:hypothetical protein
MGIAIYTFWFTVGEVTGAYDFWDGHGTFWSKNIDGNLLALFYLLSHRDNISNMAG